LLKNKVLWAEVKIKGNTLIPHFAEVAFKFKYGLSLAAKVEFAGNIVSSVAFDMTS
jgi:hypothetical protein